jgi:tetratricopeptide (TPR) repeat protein
LGGVLLRLGHLEDSLVEYAAAVARAPHDEGALLGQAEALTMAGQRVDAALALDHVSEIQEASGRLPEAADTLRRALELHETPERTRHQRGLMREIRLSAGDQAAEQLLARALRLRDEPAASPAASPAAGATTSEPTWPVRPRSSDIRPFAQHLVVPVLTPELSAVVESEDDISEELAVAEVSEVAEVADVAQVAEAAEVAEVVTKPEPESAARRKAIEVAWPEADLKRTRIVPIVVPSEPEPETAVAEFAEAVAAVEVVELQASEPEPDAPLAIPAALEPILAAVGVMEGSFDADTPLGTVGESQHQPTGDELLAASEAAELSGDSTTLRSLLLWTARAYAREGRFEAGLDATHRMLQRAPGDVDAHLVLVELYVARDWNNLAAEKLALLGRLAELNNDEATRQRLRKVATRVFPKDERLSSLCA